MKLKNGRREKKWTTRCRVQRRRREWHRRVRHTRGHVWCEWRGVRCRVCDALTLRGVGVYTLPYSRRAASDEVRVHSVLATLPSGSSGRRASPLNSSLSATTRSTRSSNDPKFPTALPFSRRSGCSSASSTVTVTSSATRLASSVAVTLKSPVFTTMRPPRASCNYDRPACSSLWRISSTTTST
jgi:hypothetical protein